MKTFKQFVEEKGLKLALDVEGEPVVISKKNNVISKKNKKDKKGKLKRTLDDEGEPVTI